MSLFITFEGIEGSGKTTHLRHLAARLRAAGHEVIETREPGGTPAGMALRALLLGPEALPLSPLAELLLYCADRAQHVEQVIRPALAARRLVLCDRFSDSTVAYQGYGRGLELDTVHRLDATARAGLWPDLTFLLDCPVPIGLARARDRRGAPAGADRFERETLEFHGRVRAGFATLAAAEPARVCLLDSVAPIADVQDRMMATVETRLGAGR